MRTCGQCGRAPRANDPMSTLQVLADDPRVALGLATPGTHTVCGECREAATGDPDPYSRPQPPRNVPGTQGDRQAWLVNNLYCPLCRRWAREDEENALGQVGVYYDEFQPPAEGVREGVYMACPECLDRFRPAIFARWKAQGVLSPEYAWPAFQAARSLH